MFWLAVIAGVLSAVFLIDFFCTVVTGETLGALIFHSSENMIAKSVIDAIPSDPVMFFIVSGLVLAFVSMLTVVSFYVAFYNDGSRL